MSIPFKEFKEHLAALRALDPGHWLTKAQQGQRDEFDNVVPGCCDIFILENAELNEKLDQLIDTFNRMADLCWDQNEYLFGRSFGMYTKREYKPVAKVYEPEVS